MRPADHVQRQTALDPARSFIVQAPAGSGKTELLIQRYLRLLATVEKPESVVAITFTRKAAAEMLRRVLEALADAHGKEPTEEHKRQTWALAKAVLARDEREDWRIEENPRRLEIQTIDALSLQLVSRMPWLSRMCPRLEMVDDATEMYGEAGLRTVGLLEEERYTQAVERLLRHVDNKQTRLAKLIANMLGRREQWLRHLRNNDVGRMRAQFEDSLARGVERALTKLAEATPAAVLAEAPGLMRFAAGQLRADGKDASALEAGAAFEGSPSGRAEELPFWLGVQTLLLTSNYDLRRRVNKGQGFPTTNKAEKQRMESLLEELRGADDFVEKLKRLKDLPQTRYSDEQWTVIEALLEILPAASRQLRLVFGERGLVDFSELTHAALNALEDEIGATDLAMAFDRKIEHLLVDEFQDTSQSQMALLERLTEGWTQGDGRTVFLVGDPMQSIYRFREAEVGLFLRTVKNGLPTVEVEPLRLTVNFRSRSNIVGWVNRTFPTVFPAEEDIAKGAVRFAKSECASAEAPGPDVEVHPFWDPQGSTTEGQPEAEAARVVEIVERAREANKSVAVLARARTHLPHILAALRQARRYQAIEIDPLAASPAVLDLMALTAALLHPGDRVSWLAVLRAPWCGLSLADLHALTGDALKAAVPELLEDAHRRARLSEDGRRRLERLRAALDAPRQRTLRAWVEGVWLRLGGPATVRNEAGLVDAEAYLDLLDKLDEGCDVDLDRLKAQVSKLFAAPDPGAGDAIEVMTIHKAKGLEFDVVIVPGMGKPAKTDDEQLMLWVENPADETGEEPELLLAPIKSAATKEDAIYKYVQSRENEKERHERQRLLYVAATRARNELHWLGAVKLDKNGAAGEPGKGSMLHLLWPQVREKFERPFEANEAPASDARQQQPLRRLASDWEAPRLETPPAEEERKAVGRYRWEGEKARLAGTVVHDLLQEIGREGAQAWSAERVRSVRPRFAQALRAAGVRERDLEEAADMVERAARLAIEDERGRWILDSNHEEAWSEVSLAGMDNGKVIERRIDRTFIDKDGVRWIIDFKTSDYTREDVEAFLRKRMDVYREQMEQYRSLYRRLDARPVRIGLYFPLLGAWREYGAQAGAARV